MTPVDLGIQDSNVGYANAEPGDLRRTVGRFPAGLAVARVAAVADETDRSRRLRTEEMRIERAAYWNQVMDALPPVREVTVMRHLGIDPRGASCQDYLRESMQIDCRLCLIYGRAEEESGQSALLGALWDASAAAPLAAYRIPVIPDEDKLMDAEEESEKAVLLDAAESQAEGALRIQVRDTIWDLVKVDDRVPSTQPSPWRTDDAVLPRDRDPLRRIEELLRKEPPK